MGGSRSGRHAWRNVGTLGSRLCLDVRDLARLGALAPGTTAAYRALGLEPHQAEQFENLPKPNGMHWSTFQRHWDRTEQGALMREGRCG